MVTRKKTAKRATRKRLPARKADSRTDERRRRVRELFGKSDAKIAEILLDEGFDVNSGPPPAHARTREAWLARNIESMRRNVTNDKDWWRKFWRERASVPRKSDDAAVEREEYIASLESDLSDIDDMIAAKDAKATAKAILQGEKRQTRALIAKARGVDQIVERAPEEQPKQKVIGVLIGTKNISDEMKAELRAQGVPIE